VEKLFVGLEELNQQVHAILSLTSGTISVAATGLYANGLLPEIIAKFRQKFPGIAIRLDSQPQDRVAEWVASRRSDIGIATLPIANSSIPTRELMRRPALCVFPAGHEFEAHNTVSADDLTNRSFISFPRGTPFRFEIDMLFERAGIDRQMLTEATTHEAVCNLVAAGLGVSIVSPYSPHIRSNPRLAFRLFKPAIPIVLGILGDEADLSVAAREFYDFVIKYVGNQQAGGDTLGMVPASTIVSTTRRMLR
jgi:DNA-binding transcriptional LysR family regulator